MRVGRAYDNDVIVDDRYVCPHHLRIHEVEPGRIVAEDLASVNGLFLRRGKRPVREATLSDGQWVRIGHTRLRFRDASHRGEPTLPDHHTQKLLGAYENPVVQAIAVVVTVAVLWLNNFLDSVERRGASEGAFELVFPLALILIWAGGWAFAGRVVLHRIKFLVHCAVIGTALVAIFTLDAAFDYATFALDTDEARYGLSVVAGLVIVAAVLYAHLRFCTLAPPLRLAGVATAISLTVVGLIMLNSRIDDSEFSPVPRYQVTLKAPTFRWASGQSPDEFFAELPGLRAGLLTEAERPTD